MSCQIICPAINRRWFRWLSQAEKGLGHHWLPLNQIFQRFNLGPSASKACGPPLRWTCRFVNTERQNTKHSIPSEVNVSTKKSWMLHKSHQSYATLCNLIVFCRSLRRDDIRTYCSKEAKQKSQHYHNHFWGSEHLPQVQSMESWNISFLTSELAFFFSVFLSLSPHTQVFDVGVTAQSKGRYCSMKGPRKKLFHYFTLSLHIPFLFPASLPIWSIPRELWNMMDF